MSTIAGNTYEYDTPTKTRTITITTSNTADSIDCNEATAPGPNPLTNQHRCYIICNDADAKMSGELNCRDAGVCEMKSNVAQCWHSGIINATAATNFILNTEYKTAEQCTMHLPYRGTATIYANAKGDGVFKKTTLISHETNSINITIIDSSGTNDDYKEECDGLNIHAEDAQFLKLTLIDADYQTENAPYLSAIYCPSNSNLSPSCIIDATRAESVADLDIYAIAGAPQNVMYYGSDTTAASVQLHCLAGYTATSGINGNTDTFDTGPCFITQSPTINPTKTPTQSPTKTPTQSPSKSPSINPSKSPSKNPSITPTKTPSRNPSKNPTISPTKGPTPSPAAPSKSPTPFPTDPNIVVHGDPTHHPIISEAQLDYTTLAPVTTVGGYDVLKAEGDAVDTITIIAVALSMLVCCLCGFGIFGLWKYQKLRAEKDSEIIRMQSDMKFAMNGHFIGAASVSRTNSPYAFPGQVGDGRITQTSPWIIPGYRETAAVSTIEMHSMTMGSAGSDGVAEGKMKDVQALKEGIDAHTGNMDINEETEETEENDVDVDEFGVDEFGGIATPMGPDQEEIGDVIIKYGDDDIISDVVTDINKDIATAGMDITMKDVNVCGYEGDSDEQLLMGNDVVTLMDEEHGQEEQDEEVRDFGQTLSDEVYAQDMMMDDIVSEMGSGCEDEEDYGDEFLQSMDTVQ